MSLIIPLDRQFLDEKGDPIVNGYVYFGTYGTNPKTNLITIYSDEGETTTLANPQRTDSYGQLENEVFFSVDYAYLVENSSNVTKEGPHDRRLSTNSSLALADALILIEATETSSNLYDIDPDWEVLPSAGIYALLFPTANTGAVTITIDGVSGTYPVEDVNSNPLVSGDIRANQPYLAYWTGTEFRLLAPYTKSGLHSILGNHTVQKFTTAGAHTYTPTVGKTQARVRMVGGGGGGGAAFTGVGGAGGAGGGGAGAEFLVDLTTVTGTITLTVGDKGAKAAVYTDPDGTAGGDTSWADTNNTVTCEGGDGGANGDASNYGDSGDGGDPSSTIVDSITLVHTETGQDGGSHLSADGGNSMLGAGGRHAQNYASSTTAAQAGQGPGAGGGGGVHNATTTEESGADGAVGIIIVEEF